MDRLKQLLVFLTGGGTLDDGWRVCGYSSRDEAVGAMNRVVGSLDRLFTDDASFSRFPADRNIARLVVYVEGASRG
ncbi:MAG: hypothetical protein KAX38_08980, partial [Candidatus Krumholzibacteria bacterium]|nr:hypothetical protein [Candidatus Krumholzibacteria bacterium]